jgi:type I restriction enzyme M protein
MANERLTENIVRDYLLDLGYTNDSIEPQQSQIEAVKRLLRGASKNGKGGKGYPEFIISDKGTPDLLIVIECKPDLRMHESPSLDRPISHAVDGVLHYAKALSKDFNVIAIAASGSTLSELKVSTYIHPKQHEQPKRLTNETGKLVSDFLPLNDYLRLSTYDPAVQARRLNDLMSFSVILHNFMRDHAKLTENEKPLLVSGTLIALRSKAFRISYDTYSPEDLQKEWLEVIRKEISRANIPNAKRENMAQPYSSIAVHPELGKSSKRFPKGVLNELIRMLNENVWPYVSIYHDFDVVGRFYGEFLKYTGGDKKALGIVLTPRHITELFSDIANVKKNDRIYDPCCGTGGFLISAMHKMFSQASTESEKEHIREDCLVGVEQQPNMYALAASNMILRGDGKANLYQGSCFDDAIMQAVIKHRCNIGFINPPYAQKDEESRELLFVKGMLDVLTPGGVGVAIVPISTAIIPSPIREELLKHHTLDAVMSMPGELFYPVGTVTCIMVFKAHIPHEESQQKTWFGYWKKDGYIKTKHKGRIDLHNSWPTIKERWIEAYRNRDDIPGESVKQYVTAKDEWCAEAYMETDYETITKQEFEKSLKDYAIFKLTNTE